MLTVGAPRAVLLCSIALACFQPVTQAAQTLQAAETAPAAAVPLVTMRSPGGAVEIGIFTQEKALAYAVKFDGHTIPGLARIGLKVEGEDLGAAATPTGSPRLSQKTETVSRRGFAAKLKADYAEAVIPLKSASGKPFNLELRAYDDGFAWRLIVPGTTTRTVEGEPSEFRIPAGSTVWFTTPSASYEGSYRQTRVEDLKHGDQLMPPAVFHDAGRQIFGAVTEANLVNYCGMRLRSDGKGALVPDFHDEKKFTVSGDIVTPWRVVMLGRDLNALVNNAIPPSLAPKPAPEIVAAKWIQPSRLGWSWMAGGGAPGVNLENMKRYVRACADLGFEGNLVDEGWSHWGGSEDEAWKMVRELVAYGDSLGVKTWLWKACPDRRGIPGLYDPKARETFFRKCAELGVAGVKLDFLNSEDTRHVAFMNDTIREAAKHRLPVVFHGCNKPTGLDYAWPNELSREGLRGQEYGVNSPLDQRHPFGRLLAGHADYSPFWCEPKGGSAGTRAHNLATLVTYTSEVMLPCEHPEKIRDLPEAEFFKSVPLVWDETRVLPLSEFGRCAAFARRRGGDWFVGVTNDKEPSPGRLSLDFLGSGAWLAEIHADTPEGRNKATADTRTVKASDTLTFDMSSYGGWCARFSKLSINRHGGRIPAGEALRVTTADPAAVVHYTLDGSEPGAASPRWPADGLKLDNKRLIRARIVSGDGAGAELAHTFTPANAN